MKIRLLLSFVPILLFGCQAPTSQTQEQEENPSRASKGAPLAETPSSNNQSPPMRKNTEYLEWSSIRINNKFPVITSRENIESLLGKPDSVIKVNFDEMCQSDFRSENSKIVYYRGVTFEQFGDTLDLIGIDFSKNKTLFIQSGSLRLDHATTTEVIKTHFPKAMKDYGKNGEESINLPTSEVLTDGNWILFFEKGRLKGIDDWFPC